MAITAAELLVRVGSDTRQAEQDIKSFGDKLNSAAKSMSSMGKQLTMGLTLPLVGAAGVALKSAGDFEQSMNVLQVVSGATGQEMQALQQQAIKLGAQTSFSAGEAAEAMLELGKAGLSSTQIMGAVPGVLDLAAAGGLSVASAAEIAANALNAFQLPAEQTSQVANMLAAAANASSVDVTDLADAFKMSSAVFASNGQSMSDMTTALAILGNNSLKGSDAGTSLKTMMLSLAAPTKEAAGMMRTLGLNVYDADGSMRPFQDIVADLIQVTAGLSDEQRNAALTTIMGSDAIRAANILVAAGTDEWNRMEGAVNKSGAAQEAADARMKGLNGAIEYLKGSLDSLLISIGTPFLTGLAAMTRGAADALTGFAALSPEVVTATLAFLGVLAAVGPIVTGLGMLVGAVGFLLTPLGLVTVAAGALAAAWATDFGGIREITADAWARVQPVLGQWVGWLQRQIPRAVGVARSRLLEISNIFGKFAGGKDFQKFQGNIGKTVDEVRSTFGDLFQGKLSFGDFGARLQEALGQIPQAISDLFGGVDFSNLVKDLQWADFIPTLSWDGVLGTFKWGDFVGTLDWANKVLTLKWGDYVFTLSWASFVATLSGWGTYVSKLDWGGMITALADWTVFVSKLAWSSLVTFLNLATFVDKLLWDTYISKIDWGTIFTTLSNWDVYISKLDWGAIIAPVADWVTYISKLDWGTYVTTVVDWSVFITALTWDAIITKLTSWETYISKLDWASFVTPFSDWSVWITVLAWDTIITALTDWGTYISKLDWGAVGLTLLDWATWIPALAWSVFITPFRWSAWVASLVWNAFIDPLFWKNFIATALRWSDYLSKINWAMVVNPVAWGVFIGKVLWDTIVPHLDWITYVAGFAWSKFVEKVNWLSIIPPFTWPTFNAPNWKGWIGTFTWPTISAPDWSTFIPDLKWPEIPSFPGWDQVVQWFAGGKTENPEKKAAGGHAKGWTVVGEKGPELAFFGGSGAEILSNGNSVKFLQSLGLPGFAEGTMPAPPMGPQMAPTGGTTARPAGLYPPMGPVMKPLTAAIGEGGKQIKAVLKDAGKDFAKSVQEATGDFSSALKNVPGLFSTSQVTQEQMDMAAAGLPQNFADDYIRQLTDEIVNGVDWAGVDPKDAARRAGLDPNLPNDIILQLVKEAWNNGSFFADPANLDLINMDAVKASVAQQDKEKQGNDNLMALFGIGDEQLVQEIAGMGFKIQYGLSQYLSEQGMAPVGAQAAAGLGAGIAQNGPTLGTGVNTGFSNWLTSPDGVTATGTMGENLLAQVNKGWKDAAGHYDWSVPTGATGGPPAPAGTDGTGTPAYAGGTLWAEPGLALVGERGPELVHFRGGERVFNADETAGMGPRVSVVINATVSQPHDIPLLARQVAREIQQKRGY